MSSKKKFVLSLLAFASALFGQASAAFGQNVLTGGNDNYRTNANLTETILKPSNVKTGSFGRLFSLSVDGQIYAQPLYQQNLAMSDGNTHNVVFVATMHNTVYAFDADTPAVPIWSVNLGPSVPSSNYTSDTGTYTDITPENGILGTPVIDPNTGTLYAVAATFENGSYFYRLHALDTGTGAEKFGAPTTITAQVTGMGDNSINGSVVFDPSQHIQRPALLLSNGIVYIAFGSHGDSAPYHGWILSYSAANVQTQLAVFNASPNGSAGAIWQSGRGLSVDDAGNIYAVTSNGDSDFTANFSDAVVKLDPSQLTVTDWFAPFNFADLNSGDDDLGASGALLVPGTNKLITGGKQGVLYVLDQTALGQTQPNDSQILQRIDLQNFGIFNMALWNRPDGPRLYLHLANSPVTQWTLTGNNLSTSPTAQSVNGFSVPFQGMALSANGTQAGTGILWVTGANTWPLPAPGILHAYNADSMDEIWNSTMTSADSIGGFVKFANPTVANGKVFVPTMDGQLLVYGLQSNTVTTPSVTGVVNAASYSGGSIAPGEMVAIFGQNIGPQNLVTGSFVNYGGTGLLYGTLVTFNGIPAPLVYTSTGTAAAIVPYALAGSSTARMQVSYNGQQASVQNFSVASAAPGLFSADASGRGPGAILNPDYSLNTPSNPASAGSIVVLYGTGGGQTNPPSTDGAITAAAMPLVADVSVTVGGQPATVLYAGNAGGEVAGVTQINLQLPTGVTGTVPIVVTVGGVSSSSAVTVSIQ
jgi:uncharacterized protein (TIGR03437 family)